MICRICGKMLVGKTRCLSCGNRRDVDAGENAATVASPISQDSDDDIIDYSSFIDGNYGQDENTPASVGLVLSVAGYIVALLGMLLFVLGV